VQALRPPLSLSSQLLECVQALHEKPALVAHWLACAGSIIQNDDDADAADADDDDDDDSSRGSAGSWAWWAK
jgi:hypothetical protein